MLEAPPPAEGREMLQVREPSEDAPSSIAQDLHDLHELRKEEKYRTNSLTITTTLQKGARELYCPFKPGKNELKVRDRLEKCIEALRTWMHINKLKLNDSKTEFMIFGTKDSLKKSITKSIKIGDCDIKAVESVRNIGAMFDSEMKMDVQVRHVCSSAWHRLHNIGKIRHYLAVDQTKMVVHAYVTSKLDYNNTTSKCIQVFPSDLVNILVFENRVGDYQVFLCTETEQQQTIGVLLAVSM